MSSQQRYRREGYIISVEEHRARGGAPGLRFRFGDLRDGKVIPFVLSNGVPVNPSPFYTIFRAQQGNTEKNDEINEETLRRLGYTGDKKSSVTLAQFLSGASRPDPRPVEIVWEVNEYGNEVQSIREVVSSKRDTSGTSAFFTNSKLPVEKEPWDEDRENGAGDAGEAGPH